jgi:Immunoglobulin I-set domain.
MECVPPIAKPIPKVIWLKDGQTFSDPRIDQSNTLKINDAKADDTANYTCVAMGFKNRTTTAELKVYTCKKVFYLFIT